MATLNVVSICGSLRKGSYNAMVQRLLPSLAPDGMTVKPAPSFADFPLYNADIQNLTGAGKPVNTLADAIRAADGVIEGVEWTGDANWVTGVQWHPERMAETDSLAKLLFRDLVAAARRAPVRT